MGNAATGTPAREQRQESRCQASLNYSSAATAPEHSRSGMTSTSHTRRSRSDGNLTHRHGPMESSTRPAPQPRQRPRYHALPTLPRRARLGIQQAPQQPRTRPHNPVGQRRAGFIREHTHHLPALQPTTRGHAKNQAPPPPGRNRNARRLTDLVTNENAPALR